MAHEAFCLPQGLDEDHYMTSRRWWTMALFQLAVYQQHYPQTLALLKKPSRKQAFDQSTPGVRTMQLIHKSLGTSVQ